MVTPQLLEVQASGQRLAGRLSPQPEDNGFCSWPLSEQSASDVHQRTASSIVSLVEYGVPRLLVNLTMWDLVVNPFGRGDSQPLGQLGAWRGQAAVSSRTHTLHSPKGGPSKGHNIQECAKKFKKLNFISMNSIFLPL